MLRRSRLTLSNPVDHVFSLTLFNPVGCDPAPLLLPVTVLHLFLQKKQTLRTSYSTLCPCCSLFLWRLYGLVTSALPASIRSKKEEHAARRGRSRPKQHFFRENPFWCFEGSWEWKCRWLSVQRPPSYFCSPSKFTAARYSATSQRCFVCLLASFLCALAFIHPIHSIEAEKPHQDGRRMPTSRSVLSANRATS